MKSFDEFFEENFEYGLSSPAKNIIKFTFEAGQQSKQAEVDELRKRIDDALVELEALSLMKTVNSNNAIKILKGNKDETGLN